MRADFNWTIMVVFPVVDVLMLTVTCRMKTFMFPTALNEPFLLNTEGSFRLKVKNVSTFISI